MHKQSVIIDAVNDYFHRDVRMGDSSDNGKKEKLRIQPVTLDEVSQNLQKLIAARVAVVRKNAEGKLVPIPVDKLEHFIGDAARNIPLYIDASWKQKIAQRRDRRRRISSNEKTRLNAAIEKYGNTFEQIDKFQNLSIVEREEILDESIESLHSLQKMSADIDLAAIIRMVEVIANTFYANYANLEDNLSSENVKNNLFGVFIKTEWIVNILIELFKNNESNRNYLLIEEIDTGSQTITNMCRALLWFIGFGLFYNDYIDRGLFTKNIRSNFKGKLARYYRRRLPDLNITIETVIKGGFRRINVEKELSQFAVGALLYDIGKVPFITYHDGTEPYDHELVKVHVLTGYNMVLKTKKYSFPVMAMSAFHHEYYGGKGSYNFSSPVIGKLTGEKYDFKSANYFMTYDEDEFKAGQALAYFPCKVIEIIDVFLALTSKKKMSYLDALKTMKTEFVTRNLQLDPLLLEIFLDFFGTCGILDTAARSEIDAIKF